MNERIWELAKKAGINLTPAQFSGVLEDEVDEFTLEDFAELIIQECADVATINQFQYDAAGNYVLKHFGVGE
jgi:hypothetical protein